MQTGNGQIPVIPDGAQKEASLQPGQHISFDLHAGVHTDCAGAMHLRPQLSQHFSLPVQSISWEQLFVCSVQAAKVLIIGHLPGLV